MRELMEELVKLAPEEWDQKGEKCLQLIRSEQCYTLNILGCSPLLDKGSRYENAAACLWLFEKISAIGMEPQMVFHPTFTTFNFKTLYGSIKSVGLIENESGPALIYLRALVDHLELLRCVDSMVEFINTQTKYEVSKEGDGWAIDRFPDGKPVLEVAFADLEHFAQRLGWERGKE